MRRAPNPSCRRLLDAPAQHRVERRHPGVPFCFHRSRPNALLRVASTVLNAGSLFHDEYVKARHQWFQEHENWRRRMGLPETLDLRRRLMRRIATRDSKARSGTSSRITAPSPTNCSCAPTLSLRRRASQRQGHRALEAGRSSFLRYLYLQGKPTVWSARCGFCLSHALKPTLVRLPPILTLMLLASGEAMLSPSV